MIKIRESAKALTALIGSLAAFLVTVNAPAEWSLWLGGAGAIVTAVATFGVPNATPSAATQVANGIQVAVDAKKAADKELEIIKQTVSGAVEQVPVLGPLATQILNSIH